MTAADFEPEPAICKEGGSGLIFPLVPNEHEWNDAGRAVLYAIFLIWCFAGVGDVSDIFMEAIEKVTSKRARKFNPVTKTFLTVYVWNPTVANLSLMALGSSAPEILLSIIELLGNEVYAGALGPSTIVGSAAFNLFCIIAVCVMAIPSGEVRYIKETRVYMVTSFFSVFAYLWLLVILMLSSENVVEVWEGIVTFLFFPLLLITAYMADKGMFGGGAPKMGRGSVISADMSKDELKALEEDIRKRPGCANMSEEMVREIMKLETAEPTSIAQYRKKVRNKGRKDDGSTAPGAPDAKPPNTDPAKIVPIDDDDETPDTNNKVEYVTFSFMLKTQAALEDIGKVEVVVQREGLLDRSCSVAYKTVDGNAKAPEDYKHAEGRLVFVAGATEQSIHVEIVDDDKYKEDQEFYVELLNPEVETNEKGKHQGALGECSTTAIKIIDNDVPGVVCFEKELVEVKEEPGKDKEFAIIVKRKDGATGKVSCKYKSEGDSALSGEDFADISGTLEFENGECEKEITCTIIGKTRYESEQLFRIILEEPEGGCRFDKLTDGGEDSCICTVLIKADIAQQGGLQKIASSVALRWDKAKTGNTNWAAQFTDALFTIYDDEDDEDGDEEKVRSPMEKCQAYFSYVIHLPWKLIFACIPPTDYCGGWVCFVCSLIFIGGVTAIIGDVAAIFGCCLGIPDAVTAITFVALGTSLPDTFASKKAAEEDPHADASVGNVTGSNSVNVFLGLGLPWSIGAIYWTLGTTDKWDRLYAEDLDVPAVFRTGAFVVKAGDLGISVAVFSCCALVCVTILALRRRAFGGELGGPAGPKYVTSFVLVCLWLIYIAISSYVSIQAMNNDSR
eukprot:TRINITY_DN3064_c0_g1_i1.p1 TRINITY_DN3064_c0_g1~~TRINITY_DN3064_c0_g1_i1.p1  ORF type:complete len:846 (-),score=210.21 TRINITY_DN3064_c0_g1_i1:95-2632(-)